MRLSSCCSSQVKHVGRSCLESCTNKSLATPQVCDLKTQVMNLFYKSSLTVVKSKFSSKSCSCDLSLTQVQVSEDHGKSQVMSYEVIRRVSKPYNKRDSGMFLFSKHSSPCLKLNYDSSAALKSQVSSVCRESSLWTVKTNSAYLWLLSDLIPSFSSLHLWKHHL